jgi:hypothetical protein
MLDVGAAFNFSLVETRGFKACPDSSSGMIDAVFKPALKDVRNYRLYVVLLICPK